MDNPLSLHQMALMMLHDLATSLESKNIADLEIEENVDQIQIDVKNVGIYLLHFQSVRKELWLSSPRLGAFHYRYDDSQGIWIDTRQKENELKKSLSDDLSVALNHPMKL